MEGEIDVLWMANELMYFFCSIHGKEARKGSVIVSPVEWTRQVKEGGGGGRPCRVTMNGLLCNIGRWGSLIHSLNGKNGGWGTERQRQRQERVGTGGG